MLPDEVDCIIIGTGLTNAMVAAACSRIGQTVLHIDANSFYGNHWASFTFEQLIDWVRLNDPQNDCLQTIPPELIEKSRLFCIDLAPRFVFSNGAMVDLLVKSNVARYHDFKNNIRILSMIDNKIQVMPCSRSDVFNSDLLSDLIDKRRLMRFIEFCVNDTISKGDGEKPINIYLDELGLNQTLQKFVINSIAMVEYTSKTKEAAERVKNFVFATERYGVSPFLFPLYGCGEYPQSFCRLSAVFGGTYCLNTNIGDIERIDNKFLVKLTDDATVKSNNLILDHNYIGKYSQTSNDSSVEFIARAILITKQSIVINENNLLSYMRIPSDNGYPICMIELNSSVMVCPKDYSIVYLWTKITGDGDAEHKFQPILKHFNQEPMWKVFFKQPLDTDRESRVDTDGLFISSPPDTDHIDYDYVISQAKKIFHTINPESEFLPRAPDSNEIITT